MIYFQVKNTLKNNYYHTLKYLKNIYIYIHVTLIHLSLLFWESIPIKYLQTFLVVLRLIWTDWDSSVALKCEDNLMTIKHWSQMDLPKLIINFWLWWFFKVIFILKCIKMMFFYFLKFIFEISTSKRSKTKKKLIFF